MNASTRIFATIVVVFAVAASGACRRGQATAAGTSVGDDLLLPYLRIHDGLAVDSLDGLSANAAEIAAAARQRGAAGAALATDAQQLQAATTLPAAREKFGTLSEALVAYTRSSGRPLPADVRQAYCPMAQKPWLQRGSMIANPYYGKQMPTCGEFK